MPGKPDPYWIEAGARMLDVLEMFRSRQEEVRLNDVTARLGMTKSTAFRMLYTLESKGYIERVPGQPTYRRRTRHRVGFASISATLPFAVEINRGVQAEAKHYGVELLTAYNEFDPQRTVRNVEELLSAGVELLIEYNADEHISHVIADRCARADVPVVAITFPVPGATTLGINNYSAGLTGGEGLGEYVAERCDGRLDWLILLDIQGSSPTQQARMTGMVDGFRKFVPVAAERVLHIHVDRFKEDGARSIESFLERNPRSRRIVVLSFNDVNALGALRAVRAARRTGHVLILSQGGVTEVRRELYHRDGCLWGAVAHHPERFGVHLMPVVMRLLRGQHVPNAIWIPHTLLTRAAVAASP